MDNMLTLLASAAIGAVTGAVATAYKSRKDLEAQYDIKLREERIEAYKVLWKELEPLAYYAPEKPLTYQVAHDLSRDLRKWYYETGGLLLSERTREPYFDLQRALAKIRLADAKPEDALPGSAIDAVKQLASRLRTSTTDDVATRVGPLLGHSIRGWFKRRLRSQPLVTVTRGWEVSKGATSGDAAARALEVSDVWRLRVVNTSPSRPLLVEKVWLEAGMEMLAEPLDSDKPLPAKLYPGEAWQGFVRDGDRAIARLDEPFRAGRASGPRWKVHSRFAGDPPASRLPAAQGTTEGVEGDVSAEPRGDTQLPP